MLRSILAFGTALLISICSFAQTTISGSIKDESTGEPLVGVNIVVKDKMIGTISDTKGNFTLKTSTETPFTLIISMIGYSTHTIEVSNSVSNLAISLKEQILMGEEIIVAASRVEESVMESSVSVEKMNIRDIQTIPTANFYDGLYMLKGVDMNVQSLMLRTPNTRGFNGNTNYRMNQLIDGIDNAPPGLNFAPGNIFGINQLDLESVELLVGASSALYGPGGMNGTIMMNSKNPFEYQGLSASAQTGIMHLGNDYGKDPSPMFEFNMRYADAVNDKFAYKVAVSYLTADDWNASDFRDKNDLNNPNSTRVNNPGYDGVNVYGDDIIVPVNLAELAPTVAGGVAESEGLVPGTPQYDARVAELIPLFPDQVISRTGYLERELTENKAENFKINGSLNYRIRESLELSLSGTYTFGSAVYTAQNRFALNDFSAYYSKLELKGNNFFIHGWLSKENAGDTYDMGGGALQFNERWKPSELWYEDYIAGFVQSALVGDPETISHRFARAVADNRDLNGNVLFPGEAARPLPGTNEFNQIWNSVISTPIRDGGSGVVDLSSMYHVEGMYDFSPHLKWFDIQVGGSYRVFNLNTEGTTFFDTPGNPINSWRYGLYGQLSKKMLNDRLNVTVSARYDKDQNFEGKFTPRGSFTYALDETRSHTIRASIQTAFRFPPMADQWVDLNVGQFRVIGGLPEVHQKYDFDTNPPYPLSGPNPLVDTVDVSNGPYQFATFRPENVQAMELGYKGLYFNKRLFIDAYVFTNTYNGFLATQALAQNPGTPEERRFLTTVSTSEPLSAFGWAFSGDFRLPKGYVLKGNVAYNSLESLEGRPPGFMSMFNTPDYRFNVGVSNIAVTRKFGFNLNYRWQNSFLWESTFGVGDVDAFSTLDAQVSYKISSIKSIVTVGGSNLLNQYYSTGFGNPQIGGLYYVKILFDEFFNR